MAIHPATLITDDAFHQRVMIAFARTAHGALTVGSPAPPDAVRLKQLEAVRRLSSPQAIRQVALDSLALVIGAPEVLTALATDTLPTDADLLTVAGRILTAYTEYAALGGSL